MFREVARLSNSFPPILSSRLIKVASPPPVVGGDDGSEGGAEEEDGSETAVGHLIKY